MNKRVQPWQISKSSGKRKVNTKKQSERILIVCEGEKTEPNYFRSFPVDREVVEIDIQGEGMNTDSLIEETIRMKNKARAKGEPYNQVWCVFDRDSFPSHNFNRAIQIAINNRIRVAYSNQAFELWYLLHFNYVVHALERKDYKSLLTKLLTHRYRKNSRTMYIELLDKQSIAIQNAKRLLNSYRPVNPEMNNPSTTVHLLVDELNERIF